MSENTKNIKELMELVNDFETILVNAINSSNYTTIRKNDIEVKYKNLKEYYDDFNFNGMNETDKKKLQEKMQQLENLRQGYISREPLEDQDYDYGSTEKRKLINDINTLIELIRKDPYIKGDEAREANNQAIRDLRDRINNEYDSELSNDPDVIKAKENLDEVLNARTEQFGPYANIYIEKTISAEELDELIMKIEEAIKESKKRAISIDADKMRLDGLPYGEHLKLKDEIEKAEAEKKEFDDATRVAIVKAIKNNEEIYRAEDKKLLDRLQEINLKINSIERVGKSHEEQQKRLDFLEKKKAALERNIYLAEEPEKTKFKEDLEKVQKEIDDLNAELSLGNVDDVNSKLMKLREEQAEIVNKRNELSNKYKENATKLSDYANQLDIDIKDIKPDVTLPGPEPTPTNDDPTKTPGPTKTPVPEPPTGNKTKLGDEIRIKAKKTLDWMMEHPVKTALIAVGITAIGIALWNAIPYLATQQMFVHGAKWATSASAKQIALHKQNVFLAKYLVHGLEFTKAGYWVPAAGSKFAAVVGGAADSQALTMIAANLANNAIKAGVIGGGSLALNGLIKTTAYKEHAKKIAEFKKSNPNSMKEVNDKYDVIMTEINADERLTHKEKGKLLGKLGKVVDILEHKIGNAPITKSAEQNEPVPTGAGTGSSGEGEGGNSGEQGGSDDPTDTNPPEESENEDEMTDEEFLQYLYDKAEEANKEDYMTPEALFGFYQNLVQDAIDRGLPQDKIDELTDHLDEILKKKMNGRSMG